MLDVTQKRSLAGSIPALPTNFKFNQMEQCKKCEINEEGHTRKCPYDEEFNSGVDTESCNCCDSCRNDCLYSI